MVQLMGFYARVLCLGDETLKRVMTIRGAREWKVVVPAFENYLTASAL